MQQGKLLSLPSTTALNRIMCGYHDGANVIGIRIGTHASLDDFLGESGIAVADAPSINKKIRATLDRLNSTPTEHEKLRQILDQVADVRYYDGELEHASSIKFLNTSLRADGLEIRPHGGGHHLFNLGQHTIAVATLTTKSARLNLLSVQTDFNRAVSQCDIDPDGAVTSACATIESVCKCIFDDLGLPYPSKQDIQGLTAELAKHLNLSPGRKDLPPDWEQVVCSPNPVPLDMRVSNRPRGPEGTLDERQEAHPRADHRQAAGSGGGA
jgi:hypothetical protein